MKNSVRGATRGLAGSAQITRDTMRSRARGAHAHGNTERQVVDGLRTEVCVKQPPQSPAQPQYSNYWAPVTHKRHTMPHPARPQHTNHWAPQTRKRHEQEHRPQRLTESSDPTQHAKGRTGDCPGPHKETTTRRNVTQGLDRGGAGYPRWVAGGVRWWAGHYLSTVGQTAWGCEIGHPIPTLRWGMHGSDGSIIPEALDLLGCRPVLLAHWIAWAASSLPPIRNSRAPPRVWVRLASQCAHDTRNASWQRLQVGGRAECQNHRCPIWHMPAPCTMGPSPAPPAHHVSMGSRVVSLH